MGDAGQCNGPIKAIYRKWFVDKLPSGESLNLPMTPLFEATCRANALPD
jgi:glutamate/aspartate transport system substrate-binding protein